MDIDYSLFESLFLAWCPPFDLKLAPEYLQDDPARAYAQFSFRDGLLLGLRLGMAASEL